MQSMNEADSRIDKLRDYFRKLSKAIYSEAEFSFLKYKLVKQNKIDDILCCVMAILPDSYKNMMKSRNGQRTDSVIAYNMLFKDIKQKFMLNPSVYLVNSSNVTKYINAFLRHVEFDIAYAEKNGF